ncbi:MAG: hypothetical protein VW202_09840 [Halieaceae bacterium]
MPYNSPMSAYESVKRCLLPAMLLLVGCSGVGPAQDPAASYPAAEWQACEGERPKVCTMIYDPVCGRRTDGALDIYASPCNACADVAVIAWHPEPCEE